MRIEVAKEIEGEESMAMERNVYIKTGNNIYRRRDVSGLIDPDDDISIVDFSSNGKRFESLEELDEYMIRQCSWRRGDVYRRFIRYSNEGHRTKAIPFYVLVNETRDESTMTSVFIVEELTATDKETVDVFVDELGVEFSPL